jgi:hypothetical protein
MKQVSCKLLRYRVAQLTRYFSKQMGQNQGSMPDFGDDDDDEDEAPTTASAAGGSAGLVSNLSYKLQMTCLADARIK